MHAVVTGAVLHATTRNKSTGADRYTEKKGIHAICRWGRKRKEVDFCRAEEKRRGKKVYKD